MFTTFNNWRSIHFIILNISLVRVVVRMLFCFNCYYACAAAFVLITSSSSAGGGNLEVKLFNQLDQTWVYGLESSTLMNELYGDGDGDSEKDVGFKITADLLVQTIWRQQDGKRGRQLFKFKLVKPELHVKNHRNEKNTTNRFVKRKGSKLETMTNSEFYAIWREGRIEKIYINKMEDSSMSNFKKGIISMFQFQLLDNDNLIETDTSGCCHVSYSSLSPAGIRKTKRNCQSEDLFMVHHPKPLLDTLVRSTSITDYHLSSEHFASITLNEKHYITLAARSNVGSQVFVEQSLMHKSTRQHHGPDEIFKELAFDDVEMTLLTSQPQLILDGSGSLLSDPDVVVQVTKHTFTDVISAHRDGLMTPFGNISSAKSFIKCVKVARRTSKDDIVKVFKSKANKNIMLQLYDIMGYTQTSDSHAAILKFLHFDNLKMADMAERYLWSLSFASQPNPDIIEDLLHKFKRTQNIPDKVAETMIGSLAAMARNLNALHTGHDGKIYAQVQDTIINYLDASKGNNTRIPFLRALVNLQSPGTLPLLLNLTRQSRNTAEIVLAWKAIRLIILNPQSSKSHVLHEEIKERALRTFYELDRKEDSSARTQAVDILLETADLEQDKLLLAGIFVYLDRFEMDREVKQYTFERVNMLGLDGVMTMNNYHVRARHGLSLAMSRRVFESQPSGCNGSLSTIQEIQRGFVKRGVVSVRLDQEMDKLSEELFGLGMYSAGLDSFMSYGEESDDTAATTEATAGMELSILGTHLRRFVFFTGQGELMGHVFSGTGSERTTAFQALVMLNDHEQSLRLGNGFIADLDVKSSASFDLSGKVTVSLWYRNADSIIEQSAGIVLAGGVNVNTHFIQTGVDFALTFEPKLELAANVEFSSKVLLCMRLKQPAMVYKHQVYKIERMGGSNGKREKILRSMAIPGKTYVLNRKNSENCNAIFNS